MSYERLLADLFAATGRGAVFGLERMERCLAALGHPERVPHWRVHIGGTNGKGSTSAFVESIARAAGLRTGLYTSPHLSQFAERFRIDGQLAPRSAIEEAFARVAGCGVADMTFFEQTTAIGLWLFAEAQVDLAILEVGLGGRLDATNAVAAEIAAVTGVAMDHQEILGGSIDAIAREKAGIFKPGQRVVIGCSGESAAVPMLVTHAHRAQVAAVTVVEAPGSIPEDALLSLSGSYQRANAACALAIIDQAALLGVLAVDREILRRGLAQARWPGRLETIADKPRIVIDGAHNPHGAAALAREISAMARPRVLVMAVSQGKDAAGMLDVLVPHFDGIVATQYRQPRTLPAAELFAITAERAPALPRSIEPEVAGALAAARSLAGGEGTVVCAGSLFLVGEVRQVVCGDEPDSVVVSDPSPPSRT